MRKEKNLIKDKKEKKETMNSKQNNSNKQNKQKNSIEMNNPRKKSKKLITIKSKKRTKGKLGNYFGDGFDVLNQEEMDYASAETDEMKELDKKYRLKPSPNVISDEEKRKAHEYQKEVLNNKQYGSNDDIRSQKNEIKGKIRRLLFLNIPIEQTIEYDINENDKKNKNKENDSKTNNINKQYTPKKYRYIQMKLDVQQITPQFLEELEHYKKKNIKIRKATLDEKDLEIITRLYNRAFMMGSDPWSPATKEQFSKILSLPHTCVLIASIGSEDVGFIILDFEGENQEIAIISGLGTDPRWRRHGIARFLGVVAWDHIRKKNSKELRCEVYEKNQPSYRLIKSLHFEEFGEKYYEF